jgi:outer membrane biosynthesis protein TonB
MVQKSGISNSDVMPIVARDYSLFLLLCGILGVVLLFLPAKHILKNDTPLIDSITAKKPPIVKPISLKGIFKAPPSGGTGKRTKIRASQPAPKPVPSKPTTSISPTPPRPIRTMSEGTHAADPQPSTKISHDFNVNQEATPTTVTHNTGANTDGGEAGTVAGTGKGTGRGTGFYTIDGGDMAGGHFNGSNVKAGCAPATIQIDVTVDANKKVIYPDVPGYECYIKYLRSNYNTFSKPTCSGTVTFDFQ